MKTRELHKMEKQARVLGYTIIFALITICIEAVVCGGYDLPLGLWEFWNFHGDWIDIVKITAGWIGGGLLLSTISMLRKEKNGLEGTLTFSKVVSISALAGIFEEITFRWLLFYSAMVWAVWINPWGFEQWIYALASPIVNFFLGQVHPGWIVGVAILLTAKTFSEGHAYQGSIGVIWSWVSGLVLYRVMFQHGIVAAMLAHFVYDVVVLEYGRRLQRWRWLNTME